MELNRFIEQFGAQHITSRANPKVAALAKLPERKYREAAGLFLAEGIKLTAEALASGIRPETVLFAESFAVSDAAPALAEKTAACGATVTVLSDSAFGKISTEKSPEGVIAVLPTGGELWRTDGFSEWQTGKRLLMLDGIRDPGNLGTILRSAEALGIDGVILSDCADLTNPKTVRASMGAIFRLPVYLTGDAAQTVRAMRSLGRRVFAAALGGHTLTLGAFETEASDCVLIGNEGHGLSPALIDACDAALRIPMQGRTESLNAAAAAVCILWEYARERR
ncbi:MAG: RNA methyltransferase [Clostridiales bacterium]|nr:RNA methyltransferase [Clostridiales bacterium]